VRPTLKRTVPLPLALAFPMFTSACALTSAADPRAWAKKIYPSCLGRDESLKQTYEHNHNVEDNCGGSTLLAVLGPKPTWAGFPSSGSGPSPCAPRSTIAAPGA
jgi:hypothetical protein